MQRCVLLPAPIARRKVKAGGYRRRGELTSQKRGMPHPLAGSPSLRQCWGLPCWWPRDIFSLLSLFQLMQQQAAIMASVAQGGYLNPMAAFAAAQMQQMAALNMNGLAATPMTPTSGKEPGGWRGQRAGKAGRIPQVTWQDMLADTFSPSGSLLKCRSCWWRSPEERIGADQILLWSGSGRKGRERLLPPLPELGPAAGQLLYHEIFVRAKPKGLPEVGCWASCALCWMVLTGGWGEQEGWDPPELWSNWSCWEGGRVLAGKALERALSHDSSFSALSLTELSFSSEHSPNGTKHPAVTYTGLLVAHMGVQGGQCWCCHSQAGPKTNKIRFVVRCNYYYQDELCLWDKLFPYHEIGQQVLREDLWCIPGMQVFGEMVSGCWRRDRQSVEGCQDLAMLWGVTRSPC